jgi:hypothetical protein
MKDLDCDIFEVPGRAEENLQDSRWPEYLANTSPEGQRNGIQMVLKTRTTITSTTARIACTGAEI